MYKPNKNINQKNPNYYIRRTNPNPAPHIERLTQNANSDKSTKDSQKTKTIDANVNIIEGKKWTKEEIIAVLALAVGIVMAIYTYRLFDQASSATKAAIKADSIAQSSLDTSRKYNNITATLQQKSLDSQISAKRQSDIVDAIKLKRDTIFINKQKKGIDAQIEAFAKNQERFKQQNEPYLQIKIDTINIKYNIQRICYSISNATKTPVKVIKSRVGCYIYDKIHSTKVDTLRFINKGFYITDSFPYEGNFTFKINITVDNYENFISKRAFFYIFGEIIYKNLVTNEIRYYRYHVKIVNTGNIAPYQEFIQSDNDVIK